MTPQEIAAIITIARRAPLKDMNEAKAVDFLLNKLEQHFAPTPDGQAGGQVKPSTAKGKAKKQSK